MSDTASREPLINVNDDKATVVRNLKNLPKKAYVNPNEYASSLRDTKTWLSRRDIRLDYEYNSEAQKENDANSVDYTIRDKNNKILETKTNQDAAKVIDQLADFIERKMDTYSTVLTF